MTTKVFMVFKYLVDQIPAVMDVLILFSARRLVKRLKADRYSKEVVKASGSLAVLCKRAVIITVISAVAVNLLQLMFASSLYNTNYTISIPLYSIILAVSILLLSRYFAEGRGIKQENDMFV